MKWKIIGASALGSLHRRDGIPCQDAYQYRILPDGTALIAVADGAGSAHRSDEGANAAVQAVLDALEAQFAGDPPIDAYREIMQAGFAAAQEGLATLAALEGALLREFACTLTAAALTPGCVVHGQIGDGALVVQAEDGSFLGLTAPQRGEYANETFFLSAENALEQAQFECHTQPIRSAAVMTDGIARLAIQIPNNQPHAGFFQPLFDFTCRVEDLAEGEALLSAFLDSRRVSTRTHDDRTLVLAVREG